MYGGKTLKFLLLALLLINQGCSSVAMEQSEATRAAGYYVAQELLLRLANPQHTNFRVGIVNTAAEFRILISAKRAPLAAEYFRGYSTQRESTWNLSWTAREQLEVSGDRLIFEVLRKKLVNPQQCAGLDEAVNKLYAELEAVLEMPMSLTEIPQEHQTDSVRIDGTSYVIQIWTGERTLAIYPDRDIDITLDNASSVLMRVISGCSNELPDVIEKHYVP